MNEKYSQLIKGLSNIDNTYSQTKNLDQRVILAKNNITLWNDFITYEYNSLPSDQYKISESTRYKLKEIFERYKVYIV